MPLLELTGGDKLLSKDNSASDSGGDAETGGQRVWDNEDEDGRAGGNLLGLF